MDPDRVRAYLQVACAGLGFDIGEIWWSSNNEGASTALAAIADSEHDPVSVDDGKKLRFVQLYTSRSYEDRRNQLVTPADEEENYKSQVGAPSDETSDDEDDHSRKQHVLSPLLVDAISKTAQVVWAHTKKQEGLLGRSDMKLQTAVGMPVAVDGNGNMCVVVMFSPNNIQSTDDAMEYLQSISQSATSTSIPSLLPAFDAKQGLVSLPHHHETNEMIPLLSSPSMADGSVITRFVSLDDAPIKSDYLSVPEVQSNHDLSSAPKDCFGIPMLPSVSLLEGKGDSTFLTAQGEASSDAFDEASYGVWSTIMGNGNQSALDALLDADTAQTSNFLPVPVAGSGQSGEPIYAINKPTMVKEKRDRLEEFASAFLDVSVFDFAEVWVPISDQSGLLGQVTNVVSSESETNQALQEFERMSDKILIEHWSGAVGRAYSSGNPVWSANQDVFVDRGRASLFSQVKIETALAVPVFSGNSGAPAFVFCGYSFVRSGSVPFVLKFVQQALRLLWDGLDKVQPHKSVGEDLWKDVAPADLGEMAADVEMQQHFIMKKRPHAAIENSMAEPMPVENPASEYRVDYIDESTDSAPVRSIYTGTGPGTSPTNVPRESQDDAFDRSFVPVKYQPIQNIQSHIQNAVQSLSSMEPMHHHVATNSHGTKRAHVFVEHLDPEPNFDGMQGHSNYTGNTSTHRNTMDSSQNSAPLPMPRPLALPNSLLMQPTVTNSRHHNAPQSQQGQMTMQSASQQGVVFQPRDQPGPIGFMQAQQGPAMSRNYTQQQQQPQQLQQMHMTMQQPQPQQQQQQQQPILQQPGGQTGYVVYNQQPQQQNDSSYDTGFDTGYPQQSQHVLPNSGNGYTQSLQTTEPLALPQHFNETSYNTNSASAPIPGMTQINIAPVPTDKLSAKGMTFAVPPQNHLMSQGGNAMQQPHMGDARMASPMPVAPKTDQQQQQLFRMPVDEGQFCLPTTEAPAPTKNPNAKPCRIQGCDDPAVSRRPYCVKHSGNRMCEHPTCSKCAQGSTRFCIAHGGGRRCTFPGCDKGARDKFFCAAHGGGKRCKFEGCKKSAVGGSSLCTAHGGGRRCAVQGCDKSAQSSTKFCVKHGGGKKCCFMGCDKVARGKTEFCAAHGGGVRCKLAGCNRVAIGKHQLCRSHGGGTRPRGPQKSGETPQPSVAGAAPGLPGFADMASV